MSYNHDAEKVHEGLCVSKDKFSFIMKALLDTKSERRSEKVELFLNKIGVEHTEENKCMANMCFFFLTELRGEQ